MNHHTNDITGVGDSGQSIKGKTPNVEASCLFVPFGRHYQLHRLPTRSTVFGVDFQEVKEEELLTALSPAY